jgi:hypothetical protein
MFSLHINSITGSSSPKGKRGRSELGTRRKHAGTLACGVLKGGVFVQNVAGKVQLQLLLEGLLHGLHLDVAL